MKTKFSYIKYYVLLGREGDKYTMEPSATARHPTRPTMEKDHST